MKRVAFVLVLLVGLLVIVPAAAQRFFFHQGGRRYHFKREGFGGFNGKPPEKRTFPLNMLAIADLVSCRMTDSLRCSQEPLESAWTRAWCHGERNQEGV